MAVFIELTVDPFIERFAEMDDGNRLTKGAGKSRVRRPLRGLEIKEDTYAYIKIIRADNTAVDLFDAGAPEGRTQEYSNFILQSVQEQRMEKHQILETFGESYIFLFGEAPRMLQCSAVLINSHDFNWKDEFLENYHLYMRGTRALEQGARTYLFYDQNIVEGYMLNAAVNITSTEPLLAQLQFQFFVTNAKTVALIGDPMFPVRGSVPMPDGVSLLETWNGEVLQLVLDQTAEGSDYWLSGPSKQAIQAVRGLTGGQSQGSQQDPNNLLGGINEWLGEVAEDTRAWLQDASNDATAWTNQALEDTLNWLGLEPDGSPKPAAALEPPGDRQWARDRPLREKVYATEGGTGLVISDEYTGPLQPTKEDITSRQLHEWEQGLESRDQAMTDAMKESGVDGADCEDPSFWEEIGLAPHFSEGGVSFGSGGSPFGGSVSFGSFPGADAIGGFVGKNVSIPGSASFSLGGSVGFSFGASASASAGVSAGASAGAYAGASAGAYASAQAQASGAAQAGVYAAAQAGGYAGAGGYLSYGRGSVAAGADVNSSGASLEVGGAPVPFAFASARGELRWP